MRKRWLFLASLVVAFVAVLAGTVYYAIVLSQRVKVGSKAFTEGVILGDIVSLLVESGGQVPYHRKQLGGTPVVWAALLQGDVDVYPEYTGTIAEELLPGVARDEKSLREALSQKGVLMSAPLGFVNTYAIGMKEPDAHRHEIRTISDLHKLPDLKFGFSNEFMKRNDGWPGLKKKYGFEQVPAIGMTHELAYLGVGRSITATDVYSTDANIRAYNLRVLEDDKSCFPEYQAVLLYRADLVERHPEVVAALLRLQGQLDAETMTDLNARVTLKRESALEVARDFLAAKLHIEVAGHDETAWERFWRNTWEHLQLVFISLVAAIVVALPLGILANKKAAAGQAILAVVGMFQTLPALAVLVLLIPFLGLGTWPAVVAMFLYSLLPIVRNTFTGLSDVPPSLRESAMVLGLPPLARLRLVELPMASRAILAGIKTAAVINVGTATIGGLVGAGGYGQPIAEGLFLGNNSLILQGAIPAALLALLVQGLFEIAERTLVSRGLRLTTAG